MTTRGIHRKLKAAVRRAAGGWAQETAIGLVEAIMAVSIFLIVGTSTVGLISSSINIHGDTHQATLGTEVAQAQIENIRALPYAKVGTVSGNPSGSVIASQPASALGFANLSAQVTTAIKYVGDGVPGGFNQTTNYKQVTVTVIQNSNLRQLAQDVTYIAPPTEADVSQASITLSVIDSIKPTPVSGVLITLQNGPPASSPVSDTTDASGTVIFPGLTYNPTAPPNNYYNIVPTLPAGYAAVTSNVSQVQLAPSQNYSGVLSVYQTATLNVNLTANGAPYSGAAIATVVVTPNSGSPTSYPVPAGSSSISIPGQTPNTNYTVTATTTSGLVATGVTQLVAGVTNYPNNLTSTFNLTLLPTVNNVSSPAPNTTYTVGQLVPIPITVSFGEPVTVAGTPQLTLETGTTDEVANYASNDGSGTLTFNYVVKPGDSSTDLNYLSTSALTLNGGAITDSAGNNAILTLPGLTLAGSLGVNKAILIDAIAPTVTITAPANGSATNDQTPTLTGGAGNLSGDSTTVTVKIYAGTGTGGALLQTFTPTRTGSPAVNWTATATTLAQGTYTVVASQADSAGNIGQSAANTFVIDTTAPVVTSINLAEANPINDPTVSWTVTFSKPVTGVTSAKFSLVNTGLTGTPAVTSTTGSGTTWTVTASTGGGSGTLQLKLSTIAGIADLAGNALGGTFTGQTYNIDRTSPLVTLTVPGNNSYSVTTTPTLSGGAGTLTGVTADLNAITVTIYSGTTTAGTVVQTLTPNQASGSWTTTVLPASALAQGTYTAQATQSDLAGNTGTSNANTFVVDSIAPTVSSITEGTDPTNAAAVSWTVTFSEPVVGVAASNFSLVKSGLTGTPAVTTVTGTGTTWTVTASTGGGSGTLQLNLTTKTGIADLAGNTLSNTLSGDTTTIDRTAPTVTNVTSTLANGSYNVGDVVPVTVTFSEPVNVTSGTPALVLATTPTNRSATYVSGSGTASLIFNYTVLATDTSADLNYAATTSLSGTIKDLAGNTATLTLPGLAATGSLATNKNIVIDTTAPTVTNVTSTLANGSYNTGDVVPVTVTFSEPVTVSGTPQLLLATTPTNRNAAYASGSGTATLTFNYTVQATDTSADLNYVATNSLGLNGGTISDVAGNNATLTLPGLAAAGSLATNKNIVIDTTAPTVSSINRTGGNPTNASTVSWTVVFSESVSGVATGNFGLVTSNIFSSPSITGVTGSGTTYTVTATTGTGDGTIELDLGVTTGITDVAGNTVGSTATGQVYTVDKTAPTVSSIVLAAASPTKATSVSWTVTFSEPVSGVAAARFALVQAGGVSGAGSISVSGSGSVYTVTANSGTGSGTLGLNQTTTTGVADTAGNALSGTFTGQVYTIDKTAPTVAASGVVLANGGSIGTADTNDTLTVTYSEILHASTLCSGWSDGSTQTATATASISSVDALTLSAASCGTLNFGSVALVGNYNTSGSARTFSASLSWDPSAKTFTIKLTSLGSGGGAGTSIAAATPSYTASTSIADLAGNSIGAGPYSGTSSRF